MYDSSKYITKSDKQKSQIYSLFRKDDLVIGTYQGGAIEFGTLIGKVDQFMSLDFIYQEVRSDNKMVTGKGFVQPLKEGSSILSLFRTCSLRSQRKTRFLLHPL